MTTIRQQMEAMQQADVLRDAESILHSLRGLVEDAENTVRLAVSNREEHRIAERLQHKLLWGFANLSLDRLATRCVDLAATMGTKADERTHGRQEKDARSS